MKGGGQIIAQEYKISSQFMSVFPNGQPARPIVHSND